MVRYPASLLADRSAPVARHSAVAARAVAPLALLALTLASSGCAVFGKSWPRHEKGPYRLLLVAPEGRADDAVLRFEFEFTRAEREALGAGRPFPFVLLLDWPTELRQRFRDEPTPPVVSPEPVEKRRKEFHAPGWGCGPRCALEAAAAVDADVVLVLDNHHPDSVPDSLEQGPQVEVDHSTAFYATLFAAHDRETVVVGQYDRSMFRLASNLEQIASLVDSLGPLASAFDNHAERPILSARGGAATSVDQAPTPAPGSGDRDGDGILDKDDACPDVPGVRSADPTKNGCPAEAVAEASKPAPTPPAPAPARSAVAAVKERAPAKATPGAQAACGLPWAERTSAGQRTQARPFVFFDDFA